MYNSDILNNLILNRKLVENSKEMETLLGFFTFYLCANRDFRYNSTYFTDSIPHFLKVIEVFFRIYDFCNALPDKLKDEEAFYLRIKQRYPDLPKVEFYFNEIFAFLPKNCNGGEYQFTILDEDSEVRIDKWKENKVILKCKASWLDHEIENMYEVALDESDVVEKIKKFLKVLRKKK